MVYSAFALCVCEREREAAKGNDGMIRRVKGELQSSVSVSSIIRKLVSRR